MGLEAGVAVAMDMKKPELNRPETAGLIEKQNRWLALRQACGT